MGKITIADLILELFRPDKDKILIDCVEITDENLKQWQRNLGYMPQDIYLQDDNTVIRNIAFGISDGKIHMKTVERAVRVANIHNFVVEELHYSCNMIVGERGVRLSGGQRQKIGIARAL